MTTIRLTQALTHLYRTAGHLRDRSFRRDEQARLKMVLFFAQGYHYAHFGQPLFHEPILKTVDGVHVHMPAGAVTDELTAEGPANSIGYARERYARMVMTDLRTLVQASRPWQDTAVGAPIDPAALGVWFGRAAETDDPDDERPNSVETAAAAKWWAGREEAAA